MGKVKKYQNSHQLNTNGGREQIQIIVNQDQTNSVSITLFTKLVGKLFAKTAISASTKI